MNQTRYAAKGEPATQGRNKVAAKKTAGAAGKAHAHDFSLPWENASSDRIIFKKWLMGSLAFVLVIGLVMPWLVLPEIERAELEQLPPQLARIVLEKPVLKIPPEPKRLEAPEPREKEQKEAPRRKEELVAKAEPKVAKAKETAALSGLLQFKDAFVDMRQAVDVSALQDTAAIQSGAGSAATVDRSILTSKHATRSAGVNVAALSRETGGVALAGRETTKVDAPENVAGTGGVRKPRPVNSRDRSIEEIRRVFDSNKGSIFAIYNRTLRSRPALQGEVVLELVIAPNGQVVECTVVASEIDDQIMIDKIVNRVRLFNFGSRDVRRTKIRYPVHFLPT